MYGGRTPPPKYVEYASNSSSKRFMHGCWALVVSMSGLGLIVAPHVLLKPPRPQGLEFGLLFCGGLPLQLFSVYLSWRSLRSAPRRSVSGRICAWTALVISAPVSIILMLLCVLLVLSGLAGGGRWP